MSQRSKDNILLKARQLNDFAQRHYAKASNKVQEYSTYATGLAYDTMAMSNKYVSGKCKIFWDFKW